MKAVGSFLLACAVTLLLRTTVLSGLAARGIVIDPLAMVTVLWALRRGDAWGATMGFALGIVADLDAAHWLGRHALVLTLLGYGIGRLSGTLVRESARAQFALVAAGTLVHQLWASAFEMRGGVAGLGFLAARALLGMLVTAALGVVPTLAGRILARRPIVGHASRTSSTD